MVSFKVVVGLLCLVAAVHCIPTKEDIRSARNVVQTEDDLLDSVYADCLRKDSMACVKYKIFNFVDKLVGQKNTISVADGVELVKTSDESDAQDVSRSIKNDETVESLLFNKVQRFLESRTLKVDLKGSEIINSVNSAARSIGDALEDDEDENDIEEGRGKKKKVKKVLGPLMALAGLKMAILGKIALAVIFFIAGKALIIAKIALILAGVIGLRKLFASGGGAPHVTHEVVSHPHHTSSHVDSGYGGSGIGYSGDIGGGYSGGHGGWQRSIDAQQIAYRGHTQAKESS
ncbi:hypothetical protein MML48_5g00002972 [Holotrichia oblita]|uniref:Uncharacterized protein n=1 Tax=Holotrichia oblita TaxID=644536 RepID=A0ACB9T4F1_HOLOL|nr:hypothetical protein MML48_5g00002972 [Holotrichia oblita]